jgi:hypothetical protein
VPAQAFPVRAATIARAAAEKVLAAERRESVGL